MSTEGLEQGLIKIRPYVDPKKSNMGLEKYDMPIFPNIEQSESMACIEENGKIRYLNGLDEFAPSIKAIRDDKERKAKIKEIRTIVARLEKENNYASNLKVDDPDFWSKVEMFRPDNREVFGKIKLICNNNEQTLNPLKKTDHLLLIKGIEAGGFSLVAKSYEDLLAGNVTKKWYLDKQIETLGVKTSPLKIKNKALAILNTLFEEQQDKLFYVAKAIATNSAQYKRRTLVDVLYEDMDSYINGHAHEKLISEAGKKFIAVTEMSMQDLKVKALIKDAVFYKYIVNRGDGMLYIQSDSVAVGRNLEEALEFFLGAQNDDYLRGLIKTIEDKWLN